MSKYLTESKGIRHEYCCTVVRIGKLFPIEGKDRISQTFVNGLSVVVRNDQCKEGDVMVYAMNETRLNMGFLHANNLFNKENQHRNHDPEKYGYFAFNGRVKLIRFSGIPSYGYLINTNEMIRWHKELNDEDWDAMVGKDFDTVCGDRLVEVYLPPKKQGTPQLKKHVNTSKKYNCIFDGRFVFHYDTQQFSRCINRFRPNDVVDITTKLHGTSFIFGNVLCSLPRWGGVYGRIFNKLPRWLRFTKERYKEIYGSRMNIKNPDINPHAKCYYSTDIWGEYAGLLAGKIPQNTTIYGEIVGYESGCNTMIQRGYDYGCAKGTNKLMIYRVVYEKKDGTRYECEIDEVDSFAKGLVEHYPELRERIFYLDRLYHGTLRDLYPDVVEDKDWNFNILERMKRDERLGMEKEEPLCRTQVPREGIVIRKVGDSVAEAFKLKTDKYMLRETKMIDRGESDLEMDENYDV